VHCGIDVRGVWLQTGARDPANFPVLLDAFTEELGSRTEDEISFQAFPHEMKFILIKPHVGAGAGYGVLLFFNVIGSGAGLINFTDVGFAVELPHRLLLGEGWDDEERQQENNAAECGQKVRGSVFHCDKVSPV
jgi:hypothetical protein